jgi:hypothetical protein
MNADRTQLLEQVAAGQLSAAEAAQRLSAETNASWRNAAGRWLRVRVTDLQSGAQKVQVNLPLVWVDAAMKLGARYQPELSNLHLDWNEIITMLQTEPNVRVVEVENTEDNQRVEIYVD